MQYCGVQCTGMYNNTVVCIKYVMGKFSQRWMENNKYTFTGKAGVCQHIDAHCMHTMPQTFLKRDVFIT